MRSLASTKSAATTDAPRSVRDRRYFSDAGLGDSRRTSMSIVATEVYELRTRAKLTQRLAERVERLAAILRSRDADYRGRSSAMPSAS